MYLQIKQLNKSYGTRQVISNVDLSMEEGEILSLLGPSGCGKTTILRMIAGLITPDSGWIQVGNRVLYDGKREMAVEERDLGMVFQDYALWPHMTVARNIAFGMRLHRKPAREIKSRVQELLELVNLSGYGDRYPYQLSGGQQQRVAVARALATEPRVVLLDEPLSSLDAALRETMGTELVELFKRLKITSINVTHDQNEAMMMSDRIMVLKDGKVQQIGTPTDLYQHPANAFVASFMGAANMFPGELVRDEDMIAVRLERVVQEEKMLVGNVDDDLREKLNGRGSLLCRPDDVRLHQEKQSIGQSNGAISTATNLLTGTVMHSSFVGGRWRTLVDVGDGEKRIVLAFAPVPFQMEQRVWVELPVERCHIVPM